MQLKKIILDNVRSYLHQEVSFPAGSLMLSGEAGSGKSSILISIEFALFGLGKGNDGVKADALMRRGADECSVSLVFALEGKEIEIRRTLKRKGEKISQSVGQLRIDDRTENFSADELKTRVLQLFNYPLDFVRKGKGLPFHYTVYTPQEQMKSILLEGSDLRLDTLRRVFGVDKYKTIKENSEVLVAFFRDKIKEKEGAILDLPEKIELLKLQEQELKLQEGELRKLEPLLSAAKGELDERRKILQEIERKIEEARKLRELLISKRAEIRSNGERILREEREISALDKEIIELEKQLNGDSATSEKFIRDEAEALAKKKREISESLKKAEIEIRNLLQVMSKAEAKKDAASSLKEKISRVTLCPECGQKVTSEHKFEIETRAMREIQEVDEKMSEVRTLKDQKEFEKTSLEKELEITGNKERAMQELEMKSDALSEKHARKKRIVQEKEDIGLRIKELEKEAFALETSLEDLKDFELEYQKKKLEFEAAREREKELEIKKAGFSRMCENLSSQILQLAKEIARKKKHEADAIYLKEMRDWISKNFSEILLKIEQSVLATLHSQFESLLRKWFAMLVEEQEMNVRLDPDFSPIVEQAGFDTEYSHLSGGERTAVALAYRLALNQVINSLISQIKTRDLLILDEPTEGFSYTQLDKMRDVLRELNLKQLILISHNPKIESFVDNVLRAQKEGHVSRVV
ncbi:MAG TPA: AAA family ATPase [Nanoarchaeota archaeon]|nr:AAA family ATPase [Nanoarchaeota archaeon]HIH65887.1 AAA family ATPase [Nanoarchaeota archaeon]